MKIKELKELIDKHPEDMEVVFQKFEDDSFNFISDGEVINNKLYLYE